MDKRLVYCLLAISAVVAAVVATVVLWPAVEKNPAPVASVAIDTASSSATKKPATANPFQTLPPLQVIPRPIAEPTTEPALDEEAPAPEDVDFTAPIKAGEVPPEVVEMMRAYFYELMSGNFDHAAMIALNTLELTTDHPKLTLLIHSHAGYCYEKLGYIDMAIEQYQLALAMFPEQRQSYQAMRRLDPEFAKTHPEFPGPVKPIKPAAKPQTESTEM